MRDAREWAEEINARYEYTDSITLSVLIQRIQSEAARSERERAARVCEDRLEFYRNDTATEWEDENTPEHYRDAFREAADAIRSLPDVDPA